MALLHLLLIEDSESDAALVIRQLEKAGYTLACERVETTEQLYAALENQTWDIIIADYQLPEFDAPYALGVLQETGRDIPFIVVSGAVGEETAVALMRLGACDYLMKDNLTRLAPAVQRELVEAQIRRERKQAEDLLQLQSTALNAAANAIIITDLSGAIQWLNPAFTRLTGYSPDEAIGKNPRDLVKSGRHDAAFYQQMWETILSGKVWQGEIINRHKNGQLYIEELTITPLVDQEGRIIQFIAIKQDITSRKLAEEQLNNSQEQYRLLVELSPDAIYVNRNNCIDFVNPAALELFGASTPEQILGKSPFELFHPDYHAVIAERIHRTLDQNQPVELIEEKIIRLDGSIRDVEVAAAPFVDGEGRAVEVILRDITEHLRAEEDIRAYNQGLEISRKVLSNLTGHLEIETILNQAVQGAIELTGMESGMLFQVDPPQTLILASHQNVPNEVVKAFNQNPIRFGEGLCGLAAGERRAVIVWDNASQDKQVAGGARNAHIRFYAALPLLIKSHCVGVLCVFARDERKPTQRSLDLLNDLCGPIALAIENAWLYKSARQDATRAEALARTAARLNTSLDLETVAQTVCEAAARAMNLPAANLLLYHDDDEELHLAAYYGFPAGYRDRYTNLKFEAYRQRPEWTMSIAQFSDLTEAADLPHARFHLEYEACSVLSAKIMKNEHFIGILSVFSTQTARHFAPDEFELLQGLANQAAQAIDNARLFEQVSAGRKHLVLLSQQLVDVQETERRRLALELHDELGQMLNSIKMSLDMMPLLAPETAREQLLRAQALVGDLIVRVRRMSLELRPSMLDDMGLLPALRWLFKNVYAQTGVEVSFEYEHLDQRFSPKIEITTYRIIQEALTNVVRHAGTKTVHIRIWADAQALNLQIMDQGKGFDLKLVSREKVSSGLSGMRERARMIGGDLAIESGPGSGTALTAQLPLLSAS